MLTGQQVPQLRLELDEVTPTVPRRLLVPGGIRLARLHLTLDAAAGGTNSHLHAFTIDGERYGMKMGDAFLDEDLDLLDEKTITVIRALGERSRIAYEYDFGDGWDHTILVEDRHTLPYGLKRAVCLDGANACPPEDCGGPWGYEELLSVLADPSHEQHRELFEWTGGPIDPTAFDIVATNVALQHVH